jgi:hypothetical protein
LRPFTVAATLPEDWAAALMVIQYASVRQRLIPAAGAWAVACHRMIVRL